MRQRPTIWLIAICAVLTGCNGSGLGLRGVGAPQPAARQIVAAPAAPLNQNDAVVRAAREEQLQRGTALNVASPTTGSEPLPLVPAEIPPEPQMAATRDEAVGQIRQKAEDETDEKPHVFDITRSRVPQFDRGRRARETEQLRKAAKANQSAVTLEEANTNAQSSKSLQYRARTHYDQAVKNIEN